MVKISREQEVHVSVCPTGKADATKCKPFTMLAGAKRESNTLHEEFIRKFSIATLVNGWMKELLTLG